MRSGILTDDNVNYSAIESGGEKESCRHMHYRYESLCEMRAAISGEISRYLPA